MLVLLSDVTPLLGAEDLQEAGDTFDDIVGVIQVEVDRAAAMVESTNENFARANALCGRWAKALRMQ